MDRGTLLVSPAMAEGAGPFTPTNILTLYAALAFAILSQPVGGLLTTRPPPGSGRFAHTVFFLWRLNPLACFHEAVLLLFAFVHGVWCSLNRPSRYSLARNQQSSELAADGADAGADTGLFEDLGTTMVVARLLRERGRNLAQDAGHSGDETSDEKRNNQAGAPLPTVGVLSRLRTFLGVFSTASAILVLVALAVCRLDPIVSVPAWMMLSGWAAVQALGVLAPASDCVFAAGRDVVHQRAIELQNTLDWVAIMSSLLTGLPFTIVRMLRMMHLQKKNPDRSVFSMVDAAWLLVTIAGLVEANGGFSRSNWRRLRTFWAEDAFAYFLKHGRGYTGFFVAIIALSFKEGVRMGILLFHGTVLHMFADWCLTVTISPHGTATSESCRALERRMPWVTFIGLCTAVCMFAESLAMYNEKETSKPRWLTWLP